VPYNESQLNESVDINISMNLLYDTTSGDSWIVVWNGSSENVSAVQNIAHYAARFSEWEYLLNGTTCHVDVSNTNITNPCSINKTTNTIYVRIPHFSGAGLGVSGGAVQTSGGGGGDDDSGGGSSSSSSTSASTTTTTTSASTTTGWSATFVPPLDNDLEKGYSRWLKKNQRVRVKIDGEDHHVGILDLDSDSVEIEVSSTPQNATLKLNESAKFDVTDDKFYDLEVLLDRISEGSANISIMQIHEAVPEEPESVAEEAAETTEPVAEEGKKFTFNRYWVIGIVAVLAVIALVFYLNWKAIKKR